MQLVNQLPTDRESDVTHRLVQAIALELWRLYGRDGTLDWTGVERHLGQIVDKARKDVRDSLSLLVSVAAASHPPTRRVVCRGSVKRAPLTPTRRLPFPPE
jgi:hypothetical protein